MRPSSGGSRRISKRLRPAWARAAISTARPSTGTGGGTAGGTGGGRGRCGGAGWRRPGGRVDGCWQVPRWAASSARLAGRRRVRGLRSRPCACGDDRRLLGAAAVAPLAAPALRRRSGFVAAGRLAARRFAVRDLARAPARRRARSLRRWPGVAVDCGRGFRGGGPAARLAAAACRRVRRRPARLRLSRPARRVGSSGVGRRGGCGRRAERRPVGRGRRLRRQRDRRRRRRRSRRPAAGASVGHGRRGCCRPARRCAASAVAAVAAARRRPRSPSSRPRHRHVVGRRRLRPRPRSPARAARPRGRDRRRCCASGSVARGGCDRSRGASAARGRRRRGARCAGVVRPAAGWSAPARRASSAGVVEQGRKRARRPSGVGGRRAGCGRQCCGSTGRSVGRDARHGAPLDAEFGLGALQSAGHAPNVRKIATISMAWLRAAAPGGSRTGTPAGPAARTAGRPLPPVRSGGESYNRGALRTAPSRPPTLKERGSAAARDAQQPRRRRPARRTPASSSPCRAASIPRSPPRCSRPRATTSSA